MGAKGKCAVLSLLTAGVFLTAQPVAGTAASPQSRAVASKAGGTLVLQTVGLPTGERSALTVSGPPQSPHSKPLRRHLSPGVSTSLKLKAGTYRVTVSRVKLRRSHKGVKRGAAALPLRRKLRVKVRSHRRAKLSVRYGTIINPGVRDVTGKIVKVLGDPLTPRGVVLRPDFQVRRGAILSAHPNRALPQGLLARALAVKRSGGKEVVRLRAASIYEVAPNMAFDIPLATSDGAGISQVIKCSDSSDVQPYVNLGQFRVTGGWTTSGWGPFKVTTGANAELHFHAAAGLRVSSHAGLSCALKLPAVGFQGMAGPIPVYGAIRPGASVDVGAAGTLHTEASTDVTLGAKIGGFPPSASPVLDFGSPRVDFGATVFAGVKAGLSLGAEIGIGAIDAANLHVDLTNSLSFVAAPGQCSWDLDLGSFSGTGELGPFSISTPSSPPLYHRNLWRRSCGPPPAPPPPPPAPSPSPTLPLVRATMGWDTDSDIDLYTWDEAGNLLYFGDREGIPGAELVEDVIPLEGEVTHPPEVFQETLSPNRRYTFGICDFNREGANVTLTVKDPGGATRTFQRTLFEAGDSAVIAISPDGPGFLPAPGWCHFIEP